MSLVYPSMPIPGRAPGAWRGQVPRSFTPAFASDTWVEFAVQVMAMDGAAGAGTGTGTGSGGPVPAPPSRAVPGLGGTGAAGGGSPPIAGAGGGDDDLGPVGTRLMVTNDLINIWEVALAPGEVQAWHRHGYPYVVVVMEDSRSEIIDRLTGEKRAPASGRGAVVFDPGGIIHQLQNIGDAPLRDRIVEFKVPLNADLLREIAR